MTTHTPLHLTCDLGGINIYFSDDLIAAMNNKALGYDRTNSIKNRIVQCVNACEGINPDAVPDLITACKAFFGIDNPPVGQHGHIDFNNAINMIEHAITKATE